MTDRKKPTKSRALRRWASRIGVALAVVLGVAAIAYSARPKPPGVDLATVTRGDLSVTLDDDGRTRVRARYTITAPLLGRVLRSALLPGDSVAEGQTIATFVPTPTPLLDAQSLAEAEARLHASSASVKQASASVEGAKTALDLATKEVSRARELFDAGALPKAELDRALGNERIRAADLATANFAVQVSRHQEALAGVIVGRTKPSDPAPSGSINVTAPVSGRVLKVHQQSEAVVSPGMALIEIGDPSNLEIVVDVLTADATRVRAGQPATVHRWGGEPLQAHVRMIEPSAFTKLSALGVEEQRVNVVLDFDDPRDRWATLGDGYRVEIAIEVARYDDAVLVPIGAIFRRGSESRAFVVDAQGVVSERTLELNAQGATHAAVKAGLEPDERVVLHPSDRVATGITVAPR